jgi:hypothetical protein
MLWSKGLLEWTKEYDVRFIFYHLKLAFPASPPVSFSSCESPLLEPSSKSESNLNLAKHFLCLHFLVLGNVPS